MKKCSKKDFGCPNQNPQPLSNFNKNKTMNDGYAYECRDCMKIYRTQHRKTKKYKESRYKWDKNNPESVSKSKKKHYRKHKDKYTEYNKDYYNRNKTHIREYQNGYYHANVVVLREQQKARRNKKPIMYSYGEYKNRSKNKKREFQLSIKQFTDLVCSPCHYCLDFIKTINGIDRVNSGQGYTLSNCVPCCSTCNSMKMGISYNDFIAHIFKIADRFKKERL